VKLKAGKVVAVELGIDISFWPEAIGASMK
jgi:hypothetical protein